MTEDEKHQHQKIKIAVSGAAETEHCGEESLQIARVLGEEIVAQDAILVTGATTGIPLWSARGAKEKGGVVVGLSPAAGEREHVEVYNLPLEYLDLIIYTGFGYSGRNLLLTRSADAVIICCGRIGTINEFTVAFEDKKPVGILEGGWATDDVIRNILKNAHRPNEKVIFDKDPKALVRRIVEMVKKEKVDHYRVYANSDHFYETCTGPDCKRIL